MKITIGGFAGAIKALHPKLLGETVGVDSLNQKPGRGDLRPWHVPLTVATVPSGRATIYRFGRDVKSDANYWFSWTTVVNVVRGYNSEDATERTFFTGSGVPKWTDNTIALAGAPFPTATQPLGVPAPVSAVIVTTSGTGVSDNTESRYYTYTYVNAKGDESAPGPVSAELICKTDDTAAIASVAAPPAGFNINRIRHYRTQSGQSGETEFFFLRETTSSTTSTTDDLRDLGEVLATDGWLPPPSDLTNLTAMWNGMLAGISGVGVRVCEPYEPYAWKIANEFLPPDATPVALGRWQQNLLVLTTAKPALLTGTSPDSLDMAPIDYGEACCAPRGVVSFGHGVAWPCEDGLAYIGTSGPKLLTAGLLTRDDWQAMSPTGIVAGIYEGAYLGFYTDAGAVRRGFLIDPLNPAGIFFLDTGYSALFFDELQDALYVLDGAGNVQKWDAGVALMTATFRSKVFVTPPANFTHARVTADAYPVTLKIDAGPFTSGQQTALHAARPALVANGTSMRFTATVADDQAFTLPDGFTATDWQMQVETTGAVQAAVLATSVKETA